MRNRQRVKRERGTAAEYDRKYKTSQRKALLRLAEKYPNAYRRMLNEERAAVGLGPVEQR